MDALAVAFTTQAHIQYFNNLNARKDKDHKMHKSILGIQNSITEVIDYNGKKKRVFIKPFPNFRSESKKHLESILVSFKAKNKVVTKNINKTKKEGGFLLTESLTPRGQLHKETIYGKSLTPEISTIKLSKRFAFAKAELIINHNEKKTVLNHLKKYENNPEVAFDTKILKKDPIFYEGEPLKEVLCFKEIYTIRKDIAPDLKLDKIVDEGIKRILKERLKEYGNKPKEAFSNLAKNPIWLNKKKGIDIKKVTITGVANAEPLHFAKDLHGKFLIHKLGKKVPVDYVSLGNNHHVAIYRDNKGNLQEKVVSLYEAVIRVNQKLNPIDKEFKTEEGWEFLFTMKQNEMFVFPNEGFDPKIIDLERKENRNIIAPNLFRVQKIASKNFMFRHQYETMIDTNLELYGKAFKILTLFRKYS